MQMKYHVEFANVSKGLLVLGTSVALTVIMTDGLMLTSTVQSRAVYKTIVLAFPTRVRRMQTMTI